MGNRCKDTDYCGVACQKIDFFDGGHRFICRCRGSHQKERQIHDILLELFRMELDLFKSQKMTTNQLRKFFQAEGITRKGGLPITKHQHTKGFSFHHYLKSGEIAFCLTGANACAMVSMDLFPGYAAIFHKHVTQPWYQKHKEFLEARGFAISSSKVKSTSTTGSVNAARKAVIEKLYCWMVAYCSRT